MRRLDVIIKLFKEKTITGIKFARILIICAILPGFMK
jgi:hypothetical protein